VNRTLAQKEESPCSTEKTAEVKNRVMRTRAGEGKAKKTYNASEVSESRNVVLGQREIEKGKSDRSTSGGRQKRSCAQEESPLLMTAARRGEG